MDELRKYESVGSVLDAIQRFNKMIKDGTIDENDDLHGREIEALRDYLEKTGKKDNAFYAIVDAFKMGYMRAYDNANASSTGKDA